MIFQIIAIIALISVLLAIWSLHRQMKLEELKTVQKELKQNRVLFQRVSASEE